MAADRILPITDWYYVLWAKCNILMLIFVLYIRNVD